MEGFYAPAEAASPPAPTLLAFNRPLAERLGIDLVGADDDGLARLFSGAELPQGADPLAFAYAGHQFGHFSPQLGDGRALLLGELVAPDGARFRSEEHTSELQSLMRISYAVFCLKKKNKNHNIH